MSQTSIRKCQSPACRLPVVTLDHGSAYPMAGVVVICFEPMRVRCHCGHVSEWGKVGA